jgi:hypothetical protein
MSLSSSVVTRGRKSWLVWLCLVLFTGACVAESIHFHPDTASADQHCSLCIAAHSVARPAPALNLIVSPTQCVALLIVSGPSIPDPSPLLSAYIRPPPTA